METNLSTKDLRAFLALSQTRNFGQTALQLHTSQSALSALIARLEEQLGARLFDRTTRSVSLTDAGQAFAVHAASLLRQTQEAVQAIQDTLALRQGKVSVAALPSLAASLVPELLARFHAAHPQVRLSLIDTLSAHAFALVRDGKVDFALTAADPQQEDLIYEPLTQDHFVLLCAPGHPLARRRTPIALAQTLAYPHVSMSATASVRQYVDEALGREDLRFAPAFEVDHIATIGALLAAGLGVGVLPETACELIAHRGLVTRALRAPGIQRPLGLVRRKSPPLSPAAQALRALLVAHFQAPGPDGLQVAGTHS